MLQRKGNAVAFINSNVLFRPRLDRAYKRFFYYSNKMRLQTSMMSICLSVYPFVCLSVYRQNIYFISS